LSLLSIEALSKSYFDKTILDNISFKIHPGDRLGLIGENGAGKTTLFKIIAGKETADKGRVIKSGNAIIGYLTQGTDESFTDTSDVLANRELDELESAIHLKEHAIASEQNHESHEYRRLTAEYASLVSKFESLDGYAYERNMREILSGLNLPENALSLPFSSLSGGEKMRVAFARILLMKPDILLLDEPTNHMDIAAVEWIEDTLSKYKGGLIVISHDRYFLDKVTNRTASLENGKLYSRAGNYTRFMEQARVESDFAMKELDGIEKELMRQTEVKQTMLSHRNMSGYHAREKVVEKLADALLDAKSKLRSAQSSKLKLSFLAGNEPKNPRKLLLKAQGLAKSYDDRLLFRDVSFEVTASDKIFLVGPNGCGKSTLLALFLGKLGDFDGSVQLSRNLTYAHMGQHVTFDDEDMTLSDEIMTRFDYTIGQAKGILARFGFYDTDIYKKISVLSGGERSRLYLACALQDNPDIMFLDEPTNHLDIPSREVLERALIEYEGAFISVSHDRYFIERCARKIFGFTDLTIKEFGSFNEYQSYNKKALKSESAANSLAKIGSGTSSNTEFDVCPTSNNGLNSLGAEMKEIKNINLKERKNRVEERRLIAFKKEQKKQLELKIELLETEKSDIESSFGKDSDYIKYERYASLLTELEKCYEDYCSLEEDIS
jgi:ATP-binding cassette subfamily F protein 3